MKDLGEKCIEGSIDAIIFGGTRFSRGNQYIEGLKQLDEIISSVFGFSAVHLGGPKNNACEQDYYFNTQKRLLHFVRSPQNSDSFGNQSFAACDVDRIANIWKEKTKFILE